jgi:hypothetical protein
VLVLVELMAWMAIASVWLPLLSLALRALPFAGAVDARALSCHAGNLLFTGADSIAGTVAIAGIRTDAVARRE